MKKTLKSVLVAITILAGVAIIYFLPDLFQDKKLYQGDITSGIALSKESADFYNETGEATLWTNSVFGGMPTYQMNPVHPSAKIFNNITKAISVITPYPANLIFLLALGAFMLFLALGANVRIAIMGAFAFAFSSYFPILIHAGHIWKVLTLMYIPPTFAGIIWAYKGKYLLGGVTAALFAAIQIAQNHVQMTYYFGIIVLIFIIFELVHSIKTKTLNNFAKASAVLLLAGIIALAINSTNLFHSYEYSKLTMRGPSELVEKGDTKVQSKGGIDKDYATQWSYGIGETFTLLIPDLKGGYSRPMQYTLKDDAEAIEKTDPRVRENLLQFSRYWGDQPFTEGPVYAGAFIMFLFFLGLFIVRGRLKWALLTATIVSILLAWGHNLMWFSSLFFDYFPLYNKFRTVSSILVIAELTIPMLAVLALTEFVKNPNIIFEKKKEFYIALAGTAGISLLFICIPGIFSLTSNMENQMLSQAMANPQQTSYVASLIDNLESVRKHIIREDAFRSLLFICVGVVVMFAFAKKHIKQNYFLGLIITLVLIDMGFVAKRYLNSNDFKPKKDVATELFPETNADRQILQDTAKYYRVLNLTGDTYQESETSYRHKSIGGYHAAKLRRYQDIITNYLSKNDRNVLNMLNAKYVITDVNRATLNREALGNAWFVDNLVWVDDANEEIASLGLPSFNPSKVAFADKKFKTSALESIEKTDTDSTAYINLTEYKANYLKYESNSSIDKLAVFSDIYYPHGWRVYIDGVEVDHLRVNYILRAMYLPKGKHTIEFGFHPKSFTVTETIGYISSFIVYFGILAIIIMAYIKYKRKDENEYAEELEQLETGTKKIETNTKKTKKLK